MVQKHIRKYRTDDTLNLVSFVASLDRVDSYDASSVKTVVLTGHIRDTAFDTHSVLPPGAPVVLSLEIAQRPSEKLVGAVEMLPGMSLAPTVISGSISPRFSKGSL